MGVTWYFRDKREGVLKIRHDSKRGYWISGNGLDKKLGLTGVWVPLYEMLEGKYGRRKIRGLRRIMDAFKAESEQRAYLRMELSMWKLKLFKVTKTKRAGFG